MTAGTRTIQSTPVRGTSPLDDTTPRTTTPRTSGLSSDPATRTGPTDGVGRGPRGSHGAPTYAQGAAAPVRTPPRS